MENELRDMEAEQSLKIKIKNMQKKALTLPASPGVYLMKNNAGKIIYVGKAKHLISRVNQYFAFYNSHDAKTKKLVENVEDFDYIITGSNIEALLLENKLIKAHNPKYNIKLKDDKSYPYLRINLNEIYPRFIITKDRNDDKAKYFGPYSSTAHLSRVLNEVRKIYKLPSCSRVFPRDIAKERPCLNFRIDRCVGVCTGEVTAGKYAEYIEGALMLLKGDYNAMIRVYNVKMLSASEELDFENAARYRDKLNSFKTLRERQKIIAAPNVEQDVFAAYTDGLCSCVSVLNIRGGVISDKQDYYFSADEILDENGLAQFIQNYYMSRDAIPVEILTASELKEDDSALLLEWLNNEADKKIRLYSPKRGENKHICDIALKNAAESAKQYKIKSARDNSTLLQIAKLLCLETIPERIEAYDISNSGSEHITCGMIVCENGNFKKKDYKKFNIKSIEAPDDYSAMREALTRRFKHLSNESDVKDGFSTPPDLILLDGGKGHVGVIKSMMASIGVNIPVFGMVKDEFHKTRMLTNGDDEINIAKHQSVFMLIYKIQEEVHRFALKGMDSRRRAAIKKSELENIPGVGPAKIKILFAAFTTVDVIKSASVEQLSAVKGISAQNARDIVKYFQDKKQDT